MENANALIVDAALTRASMLARRGRRRRVGLGDDAANSCYIVNERGVDFRMRSPVGV